MTKYLFRIDDIHESMDWNRFEAMKKIFIRHDIKPVLAIIPDNRHKKLVFKENKQKNSKSLTKSSFFKELKKLQSDGWTIAMHGYTHELKGNGGLLNINDFGEFGGLSYEIQDNKIKQAKSIMEKQGIKPDTFVAPAHSFDKNTLKCLKKYGIKIISDGIGLYPIKREGLLWIPVITWNPRDFPFGLITICLHPQEFDEDLMGRMEKFIARNNRKIISFEEVIRKYQNMNWMLNFFNKSINFLFSIFWKILFRIYRLNRKTKSGCK